MRSINPATEEVWAEYPDHDARAVDRMLMSAEDAAAGWAVRPLEECSALLLRVGELLRERKGQYAELMAREMGKPVAAGEAEVDKCAGCCDYFAHNAEWMLKMEEVATDATRSYVRYEPLGPVLAIMPWNFPFWQVFRFAAPALMAGNTVVLKHAWNVPGCANAIEKLFADAGYPRGAFVSLLVDNERAEALISHPAIRAVTLTGSERAGKAVAAAAGRVLKKVVLELGGSDPFIVLPDADVEKTAEAAVAARCINTGQSCIAAKRFIVHKDVAGRFEEAFVERMRQQRVGDPLRRDVDLGPLARRDLRENLDRQVRASVAAGAALACGGAAVGGAGFFYLPTVLLDVRPGMAAFDEETFGPVAAVTRAENVEHAVELANRTRYGLGASIWTADAAAAERLVRRIEAGCVFVNGMVKSDPRMPFGGIKLSGHGRELSAVGMREFMNLKMVWIREGYGQ